jgi:hypothetical protein
MGDNVVMSLDVAEGGTAQEGKGVHTDTVSDVHVLNLCNRL